MIPGAHNLPDDVIETAGRRASIVCVILMLVLGGLLVAGVVQVIGGWL